MKSTNQFWGLAVLTVMLTVLGGYWLYFQITTPFNLPVRPYSHTPYQYDPEMAHVLTSLAPYGGQRYEFSLHPATTLHLIGTGLLGTLAPFAFWQGQSIMEFYSQHPESAFWLFHGFLLAFNLFTVVQIYRLVTPRQTLLEHLVSVALSGAYFGLYQMAFVGLTYWSHNLFAFPMGALVLLYALHWLREQAGLTRKQRWLLGIGTGAMVATVMYFAVWVVGVVLLGGLITLIQHRKLGQAIWDAVEIGLASLLSFFVILIPAWHKLDELVGYALAIGSNSGQYGTGEAGFVTQSTFQAGLAYVLGNLQPSLIVGTLGIMLSIIAFMMPKASSKTRMALLILQVTLLIQFLALLILLIKQPSITYFSGASTIAVIMLAIGYNMLPKPSRLSHIVSILIVGSVGGLFTFNLITTLTVQAHERQNAQDRQAIVQHTRETYAETLGQPMEEVRVLYAFDTPSPCYALWFGDGFANRVASKAIQTHCPQDLYYDSDGGSIWNGEIKSIYDADFCWDLIFLPSETLRQNNQDFTDTASLEQELSVVYNRQRFASVSGLRIEFERDLCGDGWHPTEQIEQISYRWMSQTSSKIDMHLTSKTDYRITVQVFSAISDEVMSTLRLNVNGETLPLISADAPARYQADLPSEIVDRNLHATQFTFTVERTETPFSGDTRPLGVAFDWVEVTPLEDQTSVK